MEYEREKVQHKSHHDKATRQSVQTTKGKKKATDMITKWKEIGREKKKSAPNKKKMKRPMMDITNEMHCSDSDSSDEETEWNWDDAEQHHEAATASTLSLLVCSHSVISLMPILLAKYSTTTKILAIFGALVGCFPLQILGVSNFLSHYVLEVRDHIRAIESPQRQHNVAPVRDAAPPPTVPCTTEHLRKLEEMPQLQSTLSLTLESGCGDSDPWLENFFLNNNSPASQEKKTFLVIGCNKAVDSIGTARVMSRNARSFDKKVWYDTMRNVSGLGWERFRSPCAKQKQQTRFEEGRFLRQANVTGMSELLLEVHCVEALPQNFDLIHKTLNRLPLFSPEFQVHQYVVSNTTGTLRFPIEGVPGDEALGTDSCEQQSYNGSCAEVPALSLDDFVERHVTKNVDIDVLKIDVEGHDFNVLLGGAVTLQKTRYLEFEYSSRDPWASQRLEDAVEYLDLKGFTCYFMGKTSRLFKLTKCFLPEKYERYPWSNVTCVQRSQEQWAAHLEQLFIETIR